MTKNGKEVRDLKPIQRTTDGLRDTLFDALEGIIAGKTTAPEAIAICKITAQIINSVNTEIEFYKHIGRHTDLTGKSPRTVLALGSMSAQPAA